MSGQQKILNRDFSGIQLTTIDANTVDAKESKNKDEMLSSFKSPNQNK